VRRGLWHQCGDRSQLLVKEQIEHGAGVGVIISPRDLAFHKAVEYSQIYHDLGVQVLIDPQFHVPQFSNSNLASYPIDEFRARISQMQPLTSEDLEGIANSLRTINSEINSDGIISPAVVYEAGRSDIVQLNSQLFAVSRQVGDELGISTYATVVLGRSVASSDQIQRAILAPVTSLNADGWYFAFEFEPERIPSSQDTVYRCCEAGIRLACTGKPVLHAYAGPMALLSFGFGATGAAIGHCQNLWKFCLGRWHPPSGRGGGGEAPSRFFSSSLWGTIIYPDEVTILPTDLQAQILTSSPFSSQVTPGQPFLRLRRWDANKHLVYSICSTVAEIAETNDPRRNATDAINILQNAVNLHGDIAGRGHTLSDNTNAYQESWRTALSELLTNRSSDFAYLELLRA